jgi:hypothetical protein
MTLRKLALAAAVAAVLPFAATAQTTGTSGQGAGNIETGTMPGNRDARRGDTANTEGNPHTRPRGEFSQGIGGVGNEGRAGGNPHAMRDRTAAGREWQHCQSMHAGPMYDRCVRDYTVQYGAAGDPQGRFYNRGIGGVGGVPPQ